MDNNGKGEALEKGLVMVVDDTPENLSLLRQILARAGMETLALPGGNMALKACEKRKPDLLLLDVNMPEMDGYEVCRRLKSSPATMDIPVLFLSALSASSDKIKAFEAGGVDYITKPFQQEEVIARVRTHLKLNRLSTELTSRNLELEEANRNLVRLEDARDTLVQTIVHDMRSLIMAVTGYLELIGSMDGEEFGRHGVADAEKALATSTLLEEMTSQVLDVSKMESGALELERIQFDLAALSREVAGRVNVLKGERKVTAFIDDTPLMAIGDREIIGRVILNLLTNAIKFTSPKKGEIEFTVMAGPKDGAVFEISDNGPGIPVELREKVFDKYWQANGRLEGKKYGTGLGLTFCRMAVQSHGGDLSVTESASGGAKFTFTI